MSKNKVKAAFDLPVRIAVVMHGFDTVARCHRYTATALWNVRTLLRVAGVGASALSF